MKLIKLVVLSLLLLCSCNKRYECLELRGTLDRPIKWYINEENGHLIVYEYVYKDKEMNVLYDIGFDNYKLYCCDSYTDYLFIYPNGKYILRY